jgi:hypothetical protein
VPRLRIKREEERANGDGMARSGLRRYREMIHHAVSGYRLKDKRKVGIMLRQRWFLRAQSSPRLLSDG